jgi:hypothetical protein
VCGSESHLAEGLTRYSLPAPLFRIEGTMCEPCRGTPGDWPSVITRRLWEARPELPKRWGWKRKTGRPDPYDKSLSPEEKKDIIEGIQLGLYDEDESATYSVPAR